MFVQAATSLPHNLERFLNFFKTHNLNVMCFENKENLFLNTKHFRKHKAFMLRVLKNEICSLCIY